MGFTKRKTNPSFISEVGVTPSYDLSYLLPFVLMACISVSAINVDVLFKCKDNVLYYDKV